LVLVDALVTQDGRPVSGLNAADFEVRDNGVPQTVQLISHAGQPVSVMLALDASASTAGRRSADLVAAGDTLLDGLERGDRALVTTFNHIVSPGGALSDDVAVARQALRRITPSGATALFDALHVALVKTLNEPGRLLVALYTDGRDTDSWLRPDELVDTAHRSNAVIYAVATGSARRWRVLEDLASATGGAVIELDGGGDLGATFRDLLDRFRSRYQLAYTPRGVAEGGYHRLEVRVRRGGMRVQARPGYVHVPGTRR
jgi:VWFA-related protein